MDAAGDRESDVMLQPSLEALFPDGKDEMTIDFASRSEDWVYLVCADVPTMGQRQGNMITPLRTRDPPMWFSHIKERIPVLLRAW